MPAQRHQHVEDHADACQRFARERITVQIRIDDDIGRRQLRPGKVMVGDQHLPAACLGRGHARMAGDAVIDRDQQVRLQRGQLFHQRR